MKKSLPKSAIRILLILFLLLAVGGLTAFQYFKVSVGGSGTAADRDRFRSAPGGVLVISMEPETTLRASDIEQTFGMPLTANTVRIPDTRCLLTYLNAASASETAPTVLYLGFRPDLLDEAKLVTSHELAHFREVFPDCRLVFLPAHPSVARWEKLLDATDPESGLSFEETAAAYNEGIETIVSSGYELYDFGRTDWIIDNVGNYVSDYTVNADTALVLISRTIPGSGFQVTPEIAADWNAGRDFWLRAQVTSLPPADALQSKCIVVLGDSIFGIFEDSMSISGILASMAGAEIYNCAIGGITASDVSGRYDFGKSVNAILTEVPDAPKEDFAKAREALAKYASSGEKEILFLIEFGINDYLYQCPVRNADQPMDTSTYYGALSTGIARLREAYPQAGFLVLSPGYCYPEQDMYGVWLEDPLLPEYRTAAEEVASAYGLPVYRLAQDVYGLDISTFHWLSSDQVHYNESGRYCIGRGLIEYLTAAQ